MKYFPLPAGLWLAALSLFSEGCASAPRGSSVVEKTETFMSGGKAIRVETFAPAPAGRFPTVLVLHSSAGTILGKGGLVNLCRKLAAEGKTAMLLHYYDRTNTLWSGDEKIRRLWPTWADTVKDALSYAAAHPRAEPDAIGLFGYSLGGFLAVAVASTDTRVKVVVEVAGGIFENPGPDMQRMPPVMILHGRKDERVSVAHALELEGAARRLGASPALHIYEDEGHVLSSAAMRDAMTRSLEFFAANLPAR